MSLAKHVRTLGRGPGRSRALTRTEAGDAMTQILSGQAAPEAVGALLMLMRFRGESAPEIAGFVDALRSDTRAWADIGADLDWPSYSAGRTRGLPWFLLSAKLVSGAGTRVFLHGWNSHQSGAASVRAVLSDIDIPIAVDAPTARANLKSDGIVYAPLEHLSPNGLRILKLREILGLRSAINTGLRVMNPTRAGAAVQGVFHPPYRALQADAGMLLGQSALTVIKGGGGEFERHPGKAVQAFGLRDGILWQDSLPALCDDVRRLADTDPDPANIAGLWRGEYRDPFARSVVVSTAALALETLGRAAPGQGLSLADQLWRDRAAPAGPGTTS